MENKPSDVLASCFSAVIMIVVLYFMYVSFIKEPLHWVKDKYFMNTDDFAFYATIISATVLLYLFSKYYPLLKRRMTVCPHGVTGGFTYLLCEECAKEIEAQKVKEADEKRLREERVIAEIESRKAKEAEEKRLFDMKVRLTKFKQQEIDRYRRKFLKRLDFLLELSPTEFEDTIMEMFRALGYQVTQTPYSNDRGKDGIAFKNGKKYLIECKRYEEGSKIGRPPLQKFFAAMYEEKAHKGFFVTTSSFASTAYEYANQNSIELVDGERLAGIMSKAYPDGGDDYIDIMCPACGEIVRFDMTTEVLQKYCKNYHLVENNITRNDLLRRHLSLNYRDPKSKR